MTETNISVLVLTGGRRVNDALNRPRWLTPTGFTGVTYRTHVYPVNKDSKGALFIETQDTAYNKLDCKLQKFDESSNYYSTSQSEDAVTGFYIETNKFGHYVVFDGDNTDYNNILNSLYLSKITVITSGQSYRPADNGRSYDWYIRFDGKLPVIQVQREFKRCFEHKIESTNQNLDPQHPSKSTSSVIPNLNSHLETEIEHLTDKNNKLLEKNQGLVEDVEKLNQIVLEKDKNLVTAKVQYDTKEREFEAFKSKSTALDLDNEELKEGVSFWEAECNDQQDEIIKLGKKISELESQNEKLSHAIQVHQKENRDPKTTPKMQKNLQKNKLFNICKETFERYENLQYSDSTFEVFLNDFNSIKYILDCLKKLNKNINQEQLSTKLHGKQNFYEVKKHIKTGRKDSPNNGRLYWKKLNNGQKLVYLHFKKDDSEQARFIKAMH